MEELKSRDWEGLSGSPGARRASEGEGRPRRGGRPRFATRGRSEKGGGWQEEERRRTKEEKRQREDQQQPRVPGGAQMFIPVDLSSLLAPRASPSSRPRHSSSCSPRCPLPPPGPRRSDPSEFLQRASERQRAARGGRPRCMERGALGAPACTRLSRVHIEYRYRNLSVRVLSLSLALVALARPPSAPDSGDHKRNSGVAPFPSSLNDIPTYERGHFARTTRDRTSFFV